MLGGMILFEVGMFLFMYACAEKLLGFGVGTYDEK